MPTPAFQNLYLGTLCLKLSCCHPLHLQLVTASISWRCCLTARGWCTPSPMASASPSTLGGRCLPSWRACRSGAWACTPLFVDSLPWSALLSAQCTPPQLWALVLPHLACVTMHGVLAATPHQLAQTATPPTTLLPCHACAAARTGRRAQRARQRRRRGPSASKRALRPTTSCSSDEQEQRLLLVLSRHALMTRGSGLVCTTLPSCRAEERAAFARVCACF